jgi:hypothetical protein
LDVLPTTIPDFIAALLKLFVCMILVWQDEIELAKIGVKAITA